MKTFIIVLALLLASIGEASAVYWTRTGNPNESGTQVYINSETGEQVIITN